MRGWLTGPSSLFGAWGRCCCSCLLVRNVHGREGAQWPPQNLGLAAEQVGQTSARLWKLKPISRPEWGVMAE